MAYRFTNTDKWSDAWFSSLKQIEMLLFMYLCDNCDIAGFAEVNLKRWAADLNSTPDTIKGALIGLNKGIIFSSDENCIYLKNFLKHQKNLPINENNKAHIGILRRFELYRHKFDIQDINSFIESPIEGASKGLQSPTGNGIGIDNGIKWDVGENDLKKREDEFKKSIEPYLQKYGREMCNDFYMYWTEPNKSKTKLRFEMQKTWDVGRRLVTWAKNNQKYKKPISATQKVSETEYKEF